MHYNVSYWKFGPRLQFQNQVLTSSARGWYPTQRLSSVNCPLVVQLQHTRCLLLFYKFFFTGSYVFGKFNRIVFAFFFFKETPVGDQWNFTCQHGPQECWGNLLESCTLHFEKFPTAFEIIHCAEVSLYPIDAYQKVCIDVIKFDVVYRSCQHIYCSSEMWSKDICPSWY